MNLNEAQIAVLAENLYQELELWYPLMRLREEGCNVVVVGPAVQTYASKLGYPVKPDVAIADADPAMFDAVVIPGGFAPENMRRHKAMIEFVRKTHDQGSLIAAVCHAGLVLASAEIARDRDLTCVALVIPGGNVARLADDGAFRAFLRDAAQKRVRIAAASQAASLAPDSLVARTTDDVPQWTRNLITELSR